MPRNRVRTTNRGPNHDVIERAATLVIDDKVSVRKAALTFDLCHVTLHRFVKRRLSNEAATTGYKPHNKVFSAIMEAELAEYLKSSANIFYGLTPKEVRSLAYKYAIANKLKFPDKWLETKMAGPDWFSDFLKRNPTLSIRTPESTSIARACNFNKVNVGKFFDQLGSVMERYRFEPQNIYNLDETGVNTAPKPDKIVACKGLKQIGGINSHERGTLITMCLAINAVGNIIPPMFIFPRKNYHEHFLADAPVGSIGAANGSGWMQSKEFLVYLQHFVKHARPSIDNKLLLVLDNHDSHIQIPVIDFCRQNDIVLLSFPTHTSHKLQPLDRSVYGPFKKYFNTYADDWRKTHPGDRMNIYHLPSLVKMALLLAATPLNIRSGFKCSGIFPLNRFVFSEHEYAPAEVTNRPLKDAEQLSENIENLVVGTKKPTTDGTQEINSSPPPVDTIITSTIIDNILPVTSTSTSLANCRPVDISINKTNHGNEDLDCVLEPSKHESLGIISPKDIRPYPKAKFDKPQIKGRAKMKSAIWTDTPEKEELEEMKKKKVAVKGVKRNIAKGKQPAAKCTKQKSIKITTTVAESSSEEEEYFCIICFEPWSQSKRGEKWVKCLGCHQWSHEECTKGDSVHYICHNCESE